jgi:hypothetical protein
VKLRATGRAAWRGMLGAYLADFSTLAPMPGWLYEAVSRATLAVFLMGGVTLCVFLLANCADSLRDALEPGCRQAEDGEERPAVAPCLAKPGSGMTTGALRYLGPPPAYRMTWTPPEGMHVPGERCARCRTLRDCPLAGNLAIGLRSSCWPHQATISRPEERMTAQLDEIDVPEGHGLMSTLDKTGDTRVMWDRGNEEEVAAARRQFDDLTSRGYLAYKAEGKDGHQGEVIRKFDPKAERIILVKQLVGG